MEKGGHPENNIYPTEQGKTLRWAPNRVARITAWPHNTPGPSRLDGICNKFCAFFFAEYCESCFPQAAAGFQCSRIRWNNCSSSSKNSSSTCYQSYAANPISSDALLFLLFLSRVQARLNSATDQSSSEKAWGQCSWHTFPLKKI